MSRTLLAAGALAVSALPAFAGGVGCSTGQCYRETYVPPTYETVTERVLTRAPRTYAMTTPAEYGTVQETVQVSAGGRHWQVSRDAWGRAVGCWVVTPARYATVNRTVMVRPAQVVPYAVPAEYGTRSYSVQTSSGHRGWSPISGGGYAGGSAGGGYATASYGGSSGGDDDEGGYGASPVGVGIGGFGVGVGGFQSGYGPGGYGRRTDGRRYGLGYLGTGRSGASNGRGPGRTASYGRPGRPAYGQGIR